MTERKKPAQKTTLRHKSVLPGGNGHPPRLRLKEPPRNAQVGTDWESVGKMKKVCVCLDSYYASALG